MSRAASSSCSAIPSVAAAVTSPPTPRRWATSTQSVAGTQSCSWASKTSKDGGAAAASSAPAKSAARIGRRPKKYSRAAPTSATWPSATSWPSAISSLSPRPAACRTGSRRRAVRHRDANGAVGLSRQAAVAVYVGVLPHDELRESSHQYGSTPRLRLRHHDPSTLRACGVVASRQSRLDGVTNESTFYCRIAEREDRPNARLDHRTGVMLAGLRALREWLLRRNRRSRPAL